MIKVGINGFGRIGRIAARVILQKFKQELDLVCINTSGSIDTPGWTHLFKYDSVYGKYPGKVSSQGDTMIVDNKKIPVFGQRDPAKIPWEKYDTQVVIESTGIFRKSKDAKKHLRGSVKRVIISAPPKGASDGSKDDKIKMYIIGVNEDQITDQQVISLASCTTNCAAPVVKVIDESFGIEKSLMTTIHAYTTSQEILDGSHKDLRRGRAAAVNIIPTTTGAAQATAQVYPQVKEKFDGLAVRVPVTTGSLTDFVFLTKKNTTEKQVNQAFEKASKGKLKNVLAVTSEPIVSKDIVANPHSAIVDLSFTKVIGGNLVKVFAWYDNEWGYANRLVECIKLFPRF
jgi:glyceraldehyde 3-phosphate dehydrogenase